MESIEKYLTVKQCVSETLIFFVALEINATTYHIERKESINQFICISVHFYELPISLLIFLNGI